MIKNIRFNQKSKIHVKSNKKEIVFDDIENSTLSPYLEYRDNSLVTAIHIDSIEYKNNMVIVNGWVYGREIQIPQLTKEDFILKRFIREDVANALNIESSKEGFCLQFYIEDGQNVSVELGNVHINITKSGTLTPPPLEQSDNKILTPLSDGLLIVGGAPTCRNYLDEIRKHEGEIWALNDSIFWLEENEVIADKLIIGDQRFVEKQKKKLNLLKCKSVISADYIDFSIVEGFSMDNFQMKVLGRDGVSERLGEVYHGCTVANFSLQVARLLRFSTIKTVGVLLGFPTSYERIDGTKTMPEFVHHHQIRNLKNILHKIREERINIAAFEPSSNLNYL